jgi:hypothetical protein
MAYTTKTGIGDRNVVVQNGPGNSHIVWLEVENRSHAGISTLALTPDEADDLAKALLLAAGQAALNKELGAKLVPA